MDDWVRNKLTEWSLDNLGSIFEENEIDQESFKSFKEENIKLLIPKIGPQMKFLNKWKSEIGNFYDSVDLQVLTDPTSPHPNGNSLSNIQVIYVESDNIQDMEVEESIECDSANDDTFPYDSDIPIETCEPIIDLFQTLKLTVQGVAVLNYYKNHRDLNDSYRKLLCDAILFTEMRVDKTLMITPERLFELSKLVPQVFVSELSTTYYVRYSKEGSRKILPRGKLYSRYNHWRDILLQSGSSENRRGVKRKVIDESKPVRLGVYEDIFKIDCTRVDLNDQLDYLTKRVDPWNVIKQYWEKTSCHRIQELIKNNQVTSLDYLTTYPILRDINDGLKLINIDFNTQYPEKVSCLIDKYKDLEKKIYTYCVNKPKKSQEIKNQISLFENNRDKDEDVRSAIIFRWLPHLLPSPALVTSRDKSTWRPTKENVTQGFLLHVKNESALKVELETRKAKLKKFGLSEQPLSVLIGESLSSITKRLVIINDIKYVANSTIECIDLTFKSFYSLQLEFSREAAYPWIFLKDAIYKIPSDDDIVNPLLQTFINDLNRTVIN